jgi:two-component system nitrate/nitrite sensor histidine kinase NarX
MAGQTERDPNLSALLDRHRGEIATAWAEMVHRLPDSHYREQPLEDLRASTMRGLWAIIEALSSGSYADLEAYLTDVSLTRLQMGFDINEVIEALLLSKDAALPIIWQAFLPGSAMAQEAIAQLDGCLRRMIGRFGQLYAEGVSRHLDQQVARLRTLNELGRHISSVLNLDELLWAVVRLVKDTFGYYNVSIFLVDTETNELVLKAGVGGHISGVPPLGDRLKIGEEGILGWIAATGEPLLVNDVSREPRYYATPTLPHTRSELGIPIKVRGQVVGTLDVQSTGLDAFDQDDLTTLQTIADHIGAAVENARLYEQAERAAVAAERSRLARDLHDAVTQTLFSASLIAEVLPRIWERNPDEGRRRLEELRQLTRGALAEMRTLLLELRPSALVDAALNDLLRQLAESITGWARVPVNVEVEGECTLPPEVKVALYRIAQEALNNVAKHTGASQATVGLQRQPGQVRLRISDDGGGFDPEGVPPESLGLGIMRERAEAIGATLAIGSEVGRGTEVTVVWRKGSKE